MLFSLMRRCGEKRIYAIIITLYALKAWIHEVEDLHAIKLG